MFLGIWEGWEANIIVVYYSDNIESETWISQDGGRISPDFATLLTHHHMSFRDHHLYPRV